MARNAAVAAADRWIDPDDDREPERGRLWDAIFGGRPVGGTDDLFHLLETVDLARAPALYVGCGTEDRLLPHNERFRAAARARGFDVTDDFRPRRARVGALGQRRPGHPGGCRCAEWSWNVSVRIHNA